MSVKVTNAVWVHSQARKTDLLVLLALADNADEDRWIAWPSVATIARKARVGERTAQRALRRLEEQGEVSVVKPGGRTSEGNRATVYRIELEGRQSGTPGVSAASAGGDSGSRNGVAPVTPQPSRNRQEPSGVEGIFAEWVTATGRDEARTKLTPDRRRRISKALASHGLDDCLAAVQNIGQDPWARGDNERGRRFDDIEHALGTAERIERWRDWEPPKAKGAGVVPASGMCRNCNRRPRITGSTHCGPCRDELEAKLTGAAA